MPILLIVGFVFFLMGGWVVIIPLATAAFPFIVIGGVIAWALSESGSEELKERFR